MWQFDGVRGKKLALDLVGAGKHKVCPSGDQRGDRRPGPKTLPLVLRGRRHGFLMWWRQPATVAGAEVAPVPSLSYPFLLSQWFEHVATPATSNRS